MTEGRPARQAITRQPRRSWALDWVALLLLLSAGYLYGLNTDSVRCAHYPCVVLPSGPGPVLEPFVGGSLMVPLMVLGLIAVFRPTRFLRRGAAAMIMGSGVAIVIAALTTPYSAELSGSPVEHYWPWGAALAANGLWVMWDSRIDRAPYAWMGLATFASFAVGTFGVLLGLLASAEPSWGDCFSDCAPEVVLPHRLATDLWPLALAIVVLLPFAFWPRKSYGSRRFAAVSIVVIALLLAANGLAESWPQLWVPAILLLVGPGFTWRATREDADPSTGKPIDEVETPPSIGGIPARDGADG